MLGNGIRELGRLVYMDSASNAVCEVVPATIEAIDVLGFSNSTAKYFMSSHKFQGSRSLCIANLEHFSQLAAGYSVFRNHKGD